MASSDTAMMTKTEAAVEGTAEPCSLPGSSPLAFTDSQLDTVMKHAGVLHPGLRRAFVERVAYELRGQVIGDGNLFRACAKVLRESGMFDPPLQTEPISGRRTGVGKYA